MSHDQQNSTKDKVHQILIHNNQYTDTDYTQTLAKYTVIPKAMQK